MESPRTPAGSGNLPVFRWGDSAPSPHSALSDSSSPPGDSGALRGAPRGPGPVVDECLRGTSSLHPSPLQCKSHLQLKPNVYITAVCCHLIPSPHLSLPPTTPSSHPASQAAHAEEPSASSYCKARQASQRLCTPPIHEPSSVNPPPCRLLATKVQPQSCRAVLSAARGPTFMAHQL